MPSPVCSLRAASPAETSLSLACPLRSAPPSTSEAWAGPVAAASRHTAAWQPGPTRLLCTLPRATLRVAVSEQHARVCAGHVSTPCITQHHTSPLFTPPSPPAHHHLWNPNPVCRPNSYITSKFGEAQGTWPAKVASLCISSFFFIEEPQDASARRSAQSAPFMPGPHSSCLPARLQMTSCCCMPARWPTLGPGLSRSLTLPARAAPARRQGGPAAAVQPQLAVLCKQCLRAGWPPVTAFFSLAKTWLSWFTYLLKLSVAAAHPRLHLLTLSRRSHAALPSAPPPGSTQTLQTSTWRP